MEKEPRYVQLILPGYLELLKPILSLEEYRRLSTFKAKYTSATERRAEMRRSLESFLANIESF